MPADRQPIDYRRKGDRQPRPRSQWRDVASILLVCLFVLLIATGLFLALVMSFSPGGRFRLK